MSLQRRTGAARFVLDEMIVDVIERLRFVRQPPGEALVIGDWTGALAPELVRDGHEVMWRDLGELDE